MASNVVWTSSSTCDFCHKDCGPVLYDAATVYSKYWWNGSLEESKEYKIDFRTKKELFSEIEYEIKKIHDYYVAEISSVNIENGSKEFLNWIDEMVK